METLLLNYHKAQTPVFINGMGVGKIAKIEKGYVVFEIVTSKNDGKDRRLLKETIYIRLSGITSLSTGQKELPKNATAQQMDADLEGI